MTTDEIIAARFHLANLRTDLVGEEAQIAMYEQAIASAPADTPPADIADAEKRLEHIRTIAQKSRDAIAIWEEKVAGCGHPLTHSPPTTTRRTT